MYKIVVMTFCLCMVAFTSKTMAQIVKASGDCGMSNTSLPWVLMSDGTLTISGSGEMRHSQPFISVNTQIKTAIIGDSVETIGACAFVSCNNLRIVSIGSSVHTIGSSAFYNCSKLDTIISRAVIPPTLNSGNIFYNVATNIPVIIPCGTLAAYQASDWGSIFTNFVEDCPVPPSDSNGITISGKVMRPDSTYLTSGFVELYQIVSFTVYSLIDMVQIDSVGNYLFTNVSTGSYIIRAIPPGWENAFPTYYGNTSVWNQAHFVAVGNASVYGKNIIIIPQPPSGNGNALIGGYVGQSGNGTKSLSQKSVSNPAENITVYLQQEQGNDWISIVHTFTNVEGYFEFSNVAVGKYRVILDVPGLENDNPQIVEINGGETVTNIKYEMTRDSILNKSGSGTTDIQQLETVEYELQLYPNPTTGKLIIKNENVNIDNVEIYDISGKLVLSQPINNTTTIIDLQEQAAGVYFLHLNNKEGKGSVKKIVKK